MELGQKIKQLRFKAGLTQEQLAQSLGVTPQSVSKWENAASMPDITLLPALAGEFGVSIDDLFDLSAEQKLQRIENRMALESELPGDLFLDYAEYLKEQLNAFPDRGRILGLLARLYHHRMEADAAKVSRYAREAIRLAPGVKDCQWLLQLAEGHQAWDWNCSNHTRAIEFYKGLIMESEEAARSPLPYYYLLDNLIADRRVDEAKHWINPFFLRYTKPMSPWQNAIRQRQTESSAEEKNSLPETADSFLKQRSTMPVRGNTRRRSPVMRNPMPVIRSPGTRTPSRVSP